MSSATFNKIFQSANETKCRYRVMLGSAGSGKSTNVAMDYILKLSSPEYAGCSLLVVRGVEVAHLNSTFAELTGAIDRLGLNSIWDSKLNPLTIRNRTNGNSIIFRGCSDQRAIERLKSVSVPAGKIVWVWLEEATELKSTDFDIIDDRCRGKLPERHFYQLTLTFNPINSGHWIKTQLWDYESPDIFKHKSTYLDNRFIDEGYKARMLRRKELDPEGYRIYGEGEWGEVGGLVFPSVTIGDYKDKEFEQYTLGTDFGFNHSHATLLIGWCDGSPYVIREVVVTEKTTGEIIELCNKADIPKNVLMYCDSAEPDRIKEFKSAGFKAYPVSKEKNSVSNQIAWLKNRQIYIDGRCSHTQKEIQAYKWRKDPTTGEYMDEPVKFNDDCVKALIYGCEPVRKQTRIKSMEKGALGLW
ncbi:MAG: PBSX family phage terminase large subunit [Eubacterium sp.]|nr:PBSX family phage terminase large subunit [Eubacterium sp.]